MNEIKTVRIFPENVLNIEYGSIQRLQKTRMLVTERMWVNKIFVFSQNNGDLIFETLRFVNFCCNENVTRKKYFQHFSKNRNLKVRLQIVTYFQYLNRNTERVFDLGKN